MGRRETEGPAPAVSSFGPHSFASGQGRLQGGGQARGGEGVCAGRALGKLQSWLLRKLTPLSG